MIIQGITVTNREIGTALQASALQGGIIGKCGSGHYKVIPPDKSKAVVFVPATPSDRRSIKNVVGKLRRAGFNI